MKMFDARKENQIRSFVKEASAYFKLHPNIITYTEADIEADCLLAIRWRKDASDIVIVRLGDTEPRIYCDADELD